MSIQIIDYRPPKIAQVFLLAAALLHWATPLNEPLLYSNPMLAAILGVVAFSIMMWAWCLFRKHEIAICPTARTDGLIMSGIYGLSRNPMYLGVIGMLLAIAIYVGTFPFYFACLAYFIVINFIFCPYEENKLSKTFGEPYNSYRIKVRRWL
ncbi:MAG: isoprenylcysteine carboxylmethyltransferase family protein [Gammaproteobacteria bacterium]|nr:isoprenylcysteine carboxylmethyltransferase family protein [Gammaproteobacteria bacterium]